VAANAPLAKPVREEREPVERGRRPLTPILVGLGLAALAAVLFLFRARIFGGESAGQSSAPAAASPGPATDATGGAAVPDGG